jgi:cell division GTPase FtsZ
MRLLVIGCGQCGGRIANEFARLNRRARSQRSIDIITGAFAVNTDAADLSGLSSIKPDYQHRILIGRQKTGGHGVGKINELGAEIAKEDVDMLLEGVKTTRAFHETDAFLLCASAAGGTGSGSIPIFTRYLKELYSEKPVYNLIVLPFKNEEQVEQRTVYNTATCLKSVYMVADAIFMVDNQRYLRKDCAIQDNLSIINNRVVEPFFNLLSAGEETKSKHIGAKVLDAGDIIQTLMGWTAIGYSKIQIPLFNFPFGRSSDFRKKGSEAHRGIQVMESAINDVSVKFRASDAKRALYLISGSPEEMNMTLMNEIGNSLKRVATDAIIRSGDYPRASRSIEITVILSEIFSVSRVMEYFSKAIQYISSQRKSHGFEYEPTQMGEAFKDLPSLL